MSDIIQDLKYTEEDRRMDFHFFTENYQKLHQKYGNCFLAIRNGEIIGAFDSAIKALESLSDKYKPGTYSIQECNGLETANHVRIQRMAMGA